MEVVRAATEGAGGAERVGVRLSPYGKFLVGSVDDDALEFYIYLVKELAKIGIAYVHVIEVSFFSPQGKKSSNFRWENKVATFLQLGSPFSPLFSLFFKNIVFISRG